MKIPYEWQEKEIDVLGSRFIAIMVPINTSDEAGTIMAKIKEKYPKATHYPLAIRSLPFEKASDDGEPSRSTGIPLLSLLQQKEIDHVFLCVVRYFGGTKLGLSRLTRTYRESAALLLNEGTFAVEIENSLYRIELEYSDFEHLKRMFKDSDIVLGDVTFGISVSLSLLGDARIIDDVLENFPQAKILETTTIKTKRRL